ncbi:uncharacterized protein LOC141813910 [Curcuma longa]|uniref:uncharacterized protein LOC141813910 n=1 Tax=Curcuma longa TaxID=136217 RepID=UPI003D9EC19C
MNSPSDIMAPVQNRVSGRRRRRPAKFLEQGNFEDNVVGREHNRSPSVGQSSRAPEIPLTDPIPATTSKSVDLSRIPLLAKSVKDRLTLFHGRPDPWLARSWLENLTDTFVYISCTEAEKVELAVYHLRDQAVTWWKTQRIVLGERRFSWLSFREAFEREYFPEAFCQTQRQKFLSLKQGDRSVTDYHIEFSKLAEFCPHMVARDSDRMFQFTQGLAAYIRLAMSSCSVSTYREALDRALIIELTQKQVTREIDAEKSKSLSSKITGQKRSVQESEMLDFSRRQKDKRLSSGSSSGFERDQRRDVMKGKCFRCGSSSHHISDCPLDQVICYYCKQPGHIAGDCTLKAQRDPTDAASSGGRSAWQQSQRTQRTRAPQQQRPLSSQPQIYLLQGRDHVAIPTAFQYTTSSETQYLPQQYLSAVPQPYVLSAASQPEVRYTVVPVPQQPPAALASYSAPTHYVQQTTGVSQSQISIEWRHPASQPVTQPSSAEVGRAHAITREEVQRADGSVFRGL